jgi:hypothetical protein
MNPREKRMVTILGGIMVLLAAWTVKNQYLGKIKSLDVQIANLQKEQIRIAVENSDLRRGKEDWAATGRQTLGIDESRAKTEFRPDIDALVQRVGLSNTGVVLKSTPRWGRNGLRSLDCTVTAEGKLDNVLKFLYEVHQRPYLVRCRSINLSQVTGKNVPANTLRMMVNLDTLLMPEARADGLPRVQPVDLASPPAEVPVRTKLAHFEDYDDIVKRKIFEPWTPPIPPPGKVVGHFPPPGGQLPVTNQQLRWGAAAHAKTYEVYVGEESPPPSVSEGVTAAAFQSPTPLALGKTYYWRVDSINSEGVRTEGDVLQFTVFQPTTPTPPPPPVVQKRPEDENLILARIISSPRGQQAVLEDPLNKAIEDKRVEVGERLHGGILVFVHPKGAVSLKDDQLWYHPQNKPLRESVILTEDSQPELLYEVMKLEQQAVGISQRPG